MTKFIGNTAMRLIRLMEVALCAVILTAAATTARAADPVKIRIGWIAAPANLAPILFAKPGIAQNLGKTYELEPIRFNGSPPMITALNAGELDIALLAYSSFALAIENAKMDDLRAIADDFPGQTCRANFTRRDTSFSKDSPDQRRSKTSRARFSQPTGVGGASISRCASPCAITNWRTSATSSSSRQGCRA
jgi:ABC-type nitrate/sulfonate/bicarbonate transport systems, periplasmic components